MLKEAVAKADVAVTGMAETAQLATKLESDEFVLDKTKIEFDICAAPEYRNKVTSRESRVHNKKIEKIHQQCNKVKNIVNTLHCWTQTRE